MGGKIIMKGGMRKMFWAEKSTKEEGKLSGPRAIPGPVLNYLVAERKMDPDFVKLLRAVVCKSPTGEKVFNIRMLFRKLSF